MPTVVLPVTLQKVAPDVSSAPLCLSPCKIFVPSVLFTKGSKFFFLPVFSYVCGLSSFSTPGSLSRCKKFCRVLSAVWQAHRQKVLKYKKKLSEQKKNFLKRWKISRLSLVSPPLPEVVKKFSRFSFLIPPPFLRWSKGFPGSSLTHPPSWSCPPRFIGPRGGGILFFSTSFWTKKTFWTKKIFLKRWIFDMGYASHIWKH